MEQATAAKSRSLFDGTSWSEWDTLATTATTGISTAWQQQAVDLTVYQGQTARIAFFHEANNDSSVGAGWYLDDVSLSQTTPIRFTLDGEGFSGQFTANRQSQYFVVKVPAGGRLCIDLDDLDNQGINEIYVRRGSLPTAGSYNYKFSGTGADQSLCIPDAGAGDWYILVYSDSGPLPGYYTLKVKLSYGITLGSLEPNRISNTTPGTVTISGSGFTPSTSVSLVSGGATYAASAVAVVSSSRIVAEFDFLTIPVGDYALKVSNGTDSSQLPFTVFAGG
jgi:hypothetical protein